ncbi:alpha/beta fold hydrolase [Glaciecola sp. 1036]|uniref:alpha/beta fold hydrolase n=1 Tax=Alteromonadaceae TaxID=72275 RepID=UPI003D04CEE9
MKILLKFLALLLVVLFSKPILATTLIFEAGFGQDKATWKSLVEQFPANAEFTIVTYTRPSIINSETGPSTIEQDVNFLINKIKQTSDDKIILVGHSYGGLIVTEAAQQVPDLVDGIVLLEPTVRSQRQHFKAIDSQRISDDDALLKQFLPEPLKAQYDVLVRQLDQSSIDTRALPEDLPVVIFTSTQIRKEPMFFEETKQGKQQWLSLHQALVAKSKEVIHVRSSQFGHNTHKEIAEQVAQFIHLLNKKIDK